MKKVPENSWTKIFAEEIFPSFDEDFSHVLYSDRIQYHINIPVNIYVSALIIKELFQILDDEIVEELMLYSRYQYALLTTSYKEQPLSVKTFSRFRKGCYDYKSAYGIDLLPDCMTNLSNIIAKMMKVDPRIMHMDSFRV